MSGEQAPATDSRPTNPVDELLEQLRQHETRIATAKSDADTIIGKLNQDVGTIAAVRESAERAKPELDQHLAMIRDGVEAIKALAEQGRVSSAELQALIPTIHAAFNQAKEMGTQATAALESARVQADAMSQTASAIESLKARVEDTAQVAKTRSEHVEEGKQYVDKCRAEIDVVLNAARQSATNADAQHQASRQATESVNALLATAQGAKSSIDANGESAAKTLATMEGHSATTKKLSQIAEATEAKLQQYEGELAALKVESDKQLKVIESLLLGATNAGLATAWDRRSGSFKPAEQRWQWTFIASLLGILGLAIWQAVKYGDLTKPPDWQQLAQMAVFKLPILIPLVWLAIHAARQAALAKRMEEEYAFKSTTSMSFEGYRRQMADIGKDVATDSPLGQLCANTLRTLAMPPGQVYEKQRMDPTPGSAAAELVGPFADSVAKAVAAKIPVPKV